MLHPFASFTAVYSLVLVPFTSLNTYTAAQEVVEWKILKSVKDHAISLQNSDPESSSLSTKQNDYKRLLENFELLTSSYDKHVSRNGEGSLEEDVSHLEELSVTISVLEKLIDNGAYDLSILPSELQDQFHSMSPILNSVSSALVDVIDIVEKSPATSTRRYLSPKKALPDSRSAKSRVEDATALALLDTKSARRSPQDEIMGNEQDEVLSVADYEMRARGYDGFMAEDMQVNELFHAGADGHAYFGTHDFFRSQDNGFHFFHPSSGHSRRRLNEEGKCDVPDQGKLKEQQCKRLRACAKQFTLYDLFIYYFGGNIDEVTGEIGENEIVIHYDEKDLVAKYDKIQDLVNGNNNCDELLQQFHRYDESKMVRRAGSVTSICRSWGSTRKASLKSIYNFMRYKFTREIEDKHGDKVWKEEFPVNETHFEKVGENQELEFQVEAGTGSEYFKTMYVTYEFDDSVTAGIKSQNGDYKEFECDEDFGNRTRKANSTCVDQSEKYESDGELTVYVKGTSFKLSLYDFHALELMGEMYEKLIHCAGKIQQKLKPNHRNSDSHPGLGVDLTRPWKGFTQCLNDQGRWDFKSCPNFEDNLDYFLDHNDEVMVYKNFKQYFNKANTNGNDRVYVEKFMNITDIMPNILFGNKTTIGQICSYADAMDKTVQVRGESVPLIEDLPGYCCLDYPDETEWWGEQYSCTFEFGEDKGQAKPRTECKNPGPWWSSFNEDACNIYSGKWCSNPRPCERLVCVDNLRKDIMDDGIGLRKAFYNYLEKAPKIEDYGNTQQCGDLRQYLQYDRDFPDDNRICDELLHLQCRNDFIDLDEKTGGASSNSEGKELSVNTKLETPKLDEFPKESGEAWYNSNQFLQTALYGVIDTKTLIDAATDQMCTSQTSAVPGSAAPCVAAIAAIQVGLASAIMFVRLANQVSQEAYERTVNDQNADVESELHKVNYNNIFTAATNGITTFNAIQQVKQLVGGLADDLNEFIEESSDGRRLTQNDCENDPNKQCGDGLFDKCSCEDKKYKCDCSLNYDFIKMQRNAGCDSVDSDNDQKVDICEDRFKPSLILTDPKTFMCERSDPEKLCFTTEVFQNDMSAKKFLRNQVQVTDDCALQSQLDYSLEKVEGSSCSNTVFKLIPSQNYPECDHLDNSTFTNPLKGNKRDITMHVDSEDPVVTCGFHDVSENNNYLRVDDKTLFHFIDKKVSKDKRLTFSNFFYKITDNCQDRSVSVDIDVKSNEHQINRKGAILIPSQFSDRIEQVDFMYTSTSCKIDKKGHNDCLKDHSIELPIRFYEITVTAEDSSGRTSADTCKIVVVPKCGGEDRKNLEKCEDKKTYNLEYLHGLTEKSNIRYPVASLKRSWDFALSGQGFYFPPYAIDRLDEDEEYVDEDNGEE